MANLYALAREGGQIRNLISTDALIAASIQRTAADSGGMSIGTDANTTAIDIGSTGVLTTVKGNFEVEGTTTLLDTSTLEGDVDLGNGDGDVITLGGSYVSAVDVVNIGTAHASGDTDVNLRVDMGVDQDKSIIFDRTADSESVLILPDSDDAAADLATGAIRVNGAGALQWYNGASWQTAGTSAGNSLQQAYAQGNTIAATSGDGAIAFSVADTQNIAVLTLTQSDVTNNPDALIVSNAGTGAAIDLQGAGSRLITSDSANLDITTTTTGDININSVADLDLDGATVNINSAGAATLDAVGALSIGGAGVSISADGGAGLSMTTNSGNVILNNTGTGSVNMNCNDTGAFNICTSTSAAYGSTAVNIGTASESGGQRTITIGEVADASNGSLTRLYGYTLTLDDYFRTGSTWSASWTLSDAASEWDDLETALGGEMSLVAAITYAVTEGSSYWSESAGVLSPKTSGDVVAITVDDTENAIPLTLTQNDVTNNPAALSIVNAGTGYGIKLAGAGTTGHDIHSEYNNAADQTFTISAANIGAGDANLYLNSTQNTNLRVSGSNRVSTSATSVNLQDGTASFQLSSGAISTSGVTTIDLDGSGAVQINSSGGSIGIGNDGNAQPINIGTGAAARTITVGNSTGATAVDLQSGTGGINLNDGVAQLDLDGAGALTETALVSADITPSGALTLRGGGVSQFGDDTGYFNFDGSGALTESGITGFTIDVANASTLSVTGATADLTLGGRAATITLNEAGDTTLSGFTATSIVGALNELKGEISGVGVWTGVVDTVAGISANDVVCLDDANAAGILDLADANAASKKFVVGVCTVGAAQSATASVASGGKATVATSDVGAWACGDAIYLATTAGEATSTAPSASGDVVQRIGWATGSGREIVITIGEPTLI